MRGIALPIYRHIIKSKSELYGEEVVSTSSTTLERILSGDPTFSPRSILDTVSDALTEVIQNWKKYVIGAGVTLGAMFIVYKLILKRRGVLESRVEAITEELSKKFTAYLERDKFFLDRVSGVLKRNPYLKKAILRGNKDDIIEEIRSAIDSGDSDAALLDPEKSDTNTLKELILLSDYSKKYDFWDNVRTYVKFLLWIVLIGAFITILFSLYKKLLHRRGSQTIAEYSLVIPKYVVLQETLWRRRKTSVVVTFLRTLFGPLHTLAEKIKRMKLSTLLLYAIGMAALVIIVSFVLKVRHSGLSVKEAIYNVWQEHVATRFKDKFVSVSLGLCIVVFLTFLRR